MPDAGLLIFEEHLLRDARCRLLIFEEPKTSRRCPAGRDDDVPLEGAPWDFSFLVAEMKGRETRKNWMWNVDVMPYTCIIYGLSVPLVGRNLSCTCLVPY